MGRLARQTVLLGLGLVLSQLVGCAAFHPIKAYEAKYMPDEAKEPSRTDKQTINLALLRQTPRSEYLVDKGDVLGIYIEGVLGKDGETPPIYDPNNQLIPPSLGYPVTVRENGTISLPWLLKPIVVRGMSIPQIEETVRYAYTKRHRYLQPDKDRIVVTLQRPRTYDIMVIRQEAGGSDVPGDDGLGAVKFGSVKRGSGRALKLPAYENDVLHALLHTGGLPGLDAENTIYVIHNRPCPPRKDIDPRLAWSTPWGDAEPTVESQSVTKIPVQLNPGELPSFSEADIILTDGDVVFIESRDTEVYFTGGLLGGGEYTLPRDYDLDILEAISIAQGQTGMGRTAPRAIGGASVLNQDVTIGASDVVILRRFRDGNHVPIRVNLYRAINHPEERILIQPGDYILLRYTPAESVAAFVERHLLDVATIGLVATILRLNLNNAQKQ